MADPHARSTLPYVLVGAMALSLLGDSSAAADEVWVQTTPQLFVEARADAGDLVVYAALRDPEGRPVREAAVRVSACLWPCAPWSPRPSALGALHVEEGRALGRWWLPEGVWRVSVALAPDPRWRGLPVASAYVPMRRLMPSWSGPADRFQVAGHAIRVRGSWYTEDGQPLVGVALATALRCEQGREVPWVVRQDIGGGVEVATDAPAGAAACVLSIVTEADPLHQRQETAVHLRWLEGPALALIDRDPAAEQGRWIRVADTFGPVGGARVRVTWRGERPGSEELLTNAGGEAWVQGLPLRARRLTASVEVDGGWLPVATQAVAPWSSLSRAVAAGLAVVLLGSLYVGRRRAQQGRKPTHASPRHRRSAHQDLQGTDASPATRGEGHLAQPPPLASGAPAWGVDVQTGARVHGLRWVRSSSDEGWAGGKGMGASRSRAPSEAWTALVPGYWPAEVSAVALTEGPPRLRPLSLDVAIVLEQHGVLRAGQSAQERDIALSRLDPATLAVMARLLFAEPVDPAADLAELERRVSEA